MMHFESDYENHRFPQYPTPEGLKELMGGKLPTLNWCIANFDPSLYHVINYLYTLKGQTYWTTVRGAYLVNAQNPPVESYQIKDPLVFTAGISSLTPDVTPLPLDIITQPNRMKTSTAASADMGKQQIKEKKLVPYPIELMRMVDPRLNHAPSLAAQPKKPEDGKDGSK